MWQSQGFSNAQACRGDEINDSFIIMIGCFEDRRHKSKKGKLRDTHKFESCSLFEVKKGQLNRIELN